MDEIARTNQQYWTNEVVKQAGYTVPWLDLDAALLRAFVAGEMPAMPEPYAYLYPREVFADVAGKDVLCLATGGGQQSAAFGLLGANVTVYDLTEGQLGNDRIAAAHHGYPITTIQGDMRCLDALADASFDLVYQEISICFVPDVRPVYREVARVLRPGGLYRVAHMNPATYGVWETKWDGQGYRIDGPYQTGRFYDPDEGMIEFRHSFPDIIGGLAEAGLCIEGAWEDPRHVYHRPDAVPGTYDHMLTWVQQYFSIVARKGMAR